MNFKKFYSFVISAILLCSVIPQKTSATGNFSLSLQPGCNEIVLTWKSAESAVNYQPIMFLPDGSAYPLIDFPSNILNFTHKNLTEGKEYCYQILAFDKEANVIAKSSKACAKPTCGGQVEECKIILKYTVGKTQYFVNGTPFEMETAPEIKENRMFLVITYVIKHIPGATIEWESAQRMITIKTPEGKVIKLWIDNPKAEVNGTLVDIDPTNPGHGAPYIGDSRTKAPMRFIAEQLNAKVDWLGSSNTVVLTIDDIVNCACDWMEGCVKKWSETKENQFLLNFYKQCNLNEEPMQLYISKSLLSKTNQQNFKEYMLNHDNKGFVNLKLCIKDNKVRFWNPGINDEDPVPPKEPEPPSNGCCSFTIELKSTPIEALKTGESHTYQYLITNTCETGTIKIMIAEGKGIPELKRVESVTPGSFLLEAGKSKVVEVTFRMPKNTPNGEAVDYVFYLKSQCENSLVETQFSIKSISDEEPGPGPNKCCKFEYKLITDEIEELKPGDTYTYEYQILNSCETSDMKIEVTKVSNINSVSPDLFELAAKQTQTIAVKFTMPEQSQNRSTVVFSFMLRADCHYVRVITFHLKQKQVEQKGRIVVRMPLESFKGTSFKVLKKGTDEVMIFKEGSENFKPEEGTFDTGCILECKKIYVVIPMNEKLKFVPSEKVVVINQCCPDGYEEITFETKGITDDCSEWGFKPSINEKSKKLEICKGKTIIIEYYQVFNNNVKECAPLKFTLSWPDDGRIVSVTPSEFALESKASQYLRIELKMSENCAVGQYQTFPITIKAEGHGEKILSISALCKDCWCDGDIIKVKVSLVNLEDGWFEGIIFQGKYKTDKDPKEPKDPDDPKDPGKSTRIYFNKEETKWSSLKTDQCIESCVKTKKEENGKPVMWGIDFRLIECPD